MLRLTIDQCSSTVQNLAGYFVRINIIYQKQKPCWEQKENLLLATWDELNRFSIEAIFFLLSILLNKFKYNEKILRCHDFYSNKIWISSFMNEVCWIYYFSEMKLLSMCWAQVFLHNLFEAGIYSLWFNVNGIFDKTNFMFDEKKIFVQCNCADLAEHESLLIIDCFPYYSSQVFFHLLFKQFLNKFKYLPESKKKGKEQTQEKSWSFVLS